MIAGIFSIWGIYLLFSCFLTLFFTGRPIAYAACSSGFQEDCNDDGEMHHIVRRAISYPSSVSKSLKADFSPVIHNITYYNTGDKIQFTLNLTHNQSVTADLKTQLKVVLWSQFLEPEQNSLVGGVTGAAYNSSAISFDISGLASAETVSVAFNATVKSSIQPLANLFFSVLVTGNGVSGSNYHYGPASSQPTLYAVFPTVSLSRIDYSYLWVGNTTGYSMTITMPNLDFSLLVEITTNINDFSFMELHNVQVKDVGTNIKTTAGQIVPHPTASYDSSEEVPFHDRAVLDFGNLTVTGNDASKNKIVIDFNVTIRDRPQLANNSKHWVGAGMRSGYQMLWVGQEALFVYKSEPSLTAEFTTINDTTSNRYLIGDKLSVTWVVKHLENTSYEDAKNVRISFHSNTLKILQSVYYNESANTSLPLTRIDDFHSSGDTFLILQQGQEITGKLDLEVSDKISPLETLDIFMQLKYENMRGVEKLNTSHQPSPAYVAGVPGFSLKLSNSSNQIRIGGRAKFKFTILMRKMKSTLKVEVILPVNGTSIMSLVSLEVKSVGNNIANNNNLSKVKAVLNSTVGDPKLHDRGSIDFGEVANIAGDLDAPENKIEIEFEIVVNDHANVTNGSKHWVGVGVRGGKRMMWIGDVALIADVPQDRRPILQVEASCVLPNSNLTCKDSTTLDKSSKVYFRGIVSHHEDSQQYAENVKVFWMLPPYVSYSKENYSSGISYDETQQGPKFSFLDKKLHFLDRLSFSVEGTLDPKGVMPPGDTYAVSPIQLTYSPYSVSAVYGAPLVPVSFKFKSPGDGAPEQTNTELKEIYNRGFLVDEDLGILYVCQKSSERLQSSCFSTADQGSSWTAVDQQVGYIIGKAGDDLYGIARNNWAYMRKRGKEGAWYGIEQAVWDKAKRDLSFTPIKQDNANSGDPGDAETKGKDPNKWGGNAQGVLLKVNHSWQLKAQWKCCGK
ncbi:uncharacterized protein LOC111331343 [Stylophora pistillata]|uniref:Uncharacterized protein n=1 Tax=Stylophora pistillata TaxID=50429 RepID=A0A2B4S6J8_STYPI|nr:uncharacterized protein LOC111331343 [Stylophora pistillata]PFX24679.1 hypothetical protein AWC38_SpisGene10728 [Stylophora pistillata]